MMMRLSAVPVFKAYRSSLSKGYAADVAALEESLGFPRGSTTIEVARDLSGGTISESATGPATWRVALELINRDHRAFSDSEFMKLPSWVDQDWTVVSSASDGTHMFQVIERDGWRMLQERKANDPEWKLVKATTENDVAWTDENARVDFGRMGPHERQYLSDAFNGTSPGREKDDVLAELMVERVGGDYGDLRGPGVFLPSLSDEEAVQLQHAYADLLQTADDSRDLKTVHDLSAADWRVVFERANLPRHKMGSLADGWTTSLRYNDEQAYLGLHDGGSWRVLEKNGTTLLQQREDSTDFLDVNAEWKRAADS